MAATGQTINDRLNAVRYALAGQGLARTVCKATTEEVLGPKKKHIDYLLACTDEPNVSIPQLANLLIDRSQNTSWTVVFKSLITIHHLLNYGNERFTQYLATSNHSFELNDFMDRTTPQGYGMSTFVRRYAKYINNKISSYKTLAIDLCKVKPGKDNGLRTMNMDNLCKTLPVVHTQFDSLLDFGVEAKDLNNGIIMAAFRLLYKDLNRIFVAYQEAVINLVERYFKLSRKKTREALNMYKKYLDRMDKVANFFKIVEAVGLDKNEMPDTSKLTSLLSVLEDHMAQLEAKKRGANVASPDPDDDGEDPVTSNKQDPAGSSEQEKEATKGDESQKKTPESTSTQNTKAPTPEVAKKAPPPARPSPVAAPKASTHSESKPTPAGQTTTHDAEKKAPPERPAKPPSRPPPPSGTSQTSTPAAQPPSTSPAPNPSSGNDDNEKTNDGDANSPGEPPSSAPATAVQEGSSTEQPTPDEPEHAPTNDVPPQANGSGSLAAVSGNHDEGHADEPSNNGGDDSSTNLPTCSNTATGVVDQESDSNTEAQEVESVETNHVATNNVNNNNHDNHTSPDDIEPPPPPPPID